MTYPFARRLRATGLVAAPLLWVLMSGVAEAALSADQVWQSWKDAGAKVGLSVTAATEVRGDGRLVLNGVTLAAGTARGATISDLTLVEQPDGSVLITPGSDIGWSASGTTIATATLKVAHDGLTLTATENAGAIVYDYKATSVTASFDSSYPGINNGDAGMQGKVAFEGLSGRYSDQPGANRVVGFDINAARLAYDVTTTDPKLPLRTTSVSDTEDVAMKLSVTLPPTVALTTMYTPSSFAKALDEGLAVTLTTAQGLSTASIKYVWESSINSETRMTARPGTASFGLDAQRLLIEAGSDGLEMMVIRDSMTFPVGLTVGPVLTRLLLPVLVRETAEDYAFKLSLSDVMVNDEYWEILNPTGVLPREPADLSIDVSGKARVDFLAMAAAEEAGTPPPEPILETLTIADLSARIAGAAMTGSGDFTFDTSSGVPLPLGEATVSLTGANTLIDGLIEAGLLTAESASGPRMMMAMFFAPTDAPDSLTSRIEAKAGGQIFVNGQRMQ